MAERVETTDWCRIIEDVVKAGIADAEAGRYITIATAEQGEVWLNQKIAKLQGLTNEH
jgi:predicted transcriptional regulator